MKIEQAFKKMRSGSVLISPEKINTRIHGNHLQQLVGDDWIDSTLTIKEMFGVWRKS